MIRSSVNGSRFIADLLSGPDSPTKLIQNLDRFLGGQFIANGAALVPDCDSTAADISHESRRQPKTAFAGSCVIEKFPPSPTAAMKCMLTTRMLPMLPMMPGVVPGVVPGVMTRVMARVMTKVMPRVMTRVMPMVAVMKVMTMPSPMAYSICNPNRSGLYYRSSHVSL